MDDRIPVDVEAEEAVIGALLIDPDALPRVQALDLQAHEFYRLDCRLVFQAIAECARQGRSADYITVCSLLEQTPHDDDGQTAMAFIGGPATVSRLITRTAGSANVAHYAQLVKLAAWRRALIEATGRLAELAYNGIGTVPELQQEAQLLLRPAMAIEEPDSHLYGTDDALVDYLGRQVEREDLLRSDPDRMVALPWPALDRVFGEIEPGMVHVVGARPGVGKTMYLEEIAEHNARRRHACAFYHLELSHRTMLHRRMARHSGVSYQELNRGYHGPEVSSALDRMREWQRLITYIHAPGWTAERIMADVVRLQAEGKADLVVVDYLQKLGMPALRGYNESSLIGRVVGALKDGAEKLGIPIFLGCQVTRDLKSRGAGARPQLTDLFGSGLIEAFVNQVCIIHRPDNERDADDVSPEVLQFFADKNTTGPGGKVELLSVPGRFMFAESTVDKEPMW